MKETLLEFAISREDRELLAELRCCLRSGPVQAAREACAAEPKPDSREILCILGARRLLAPSWPVKYGGRGSAPLSTLLVAEELGRHGVSTTLHTISIQAAGAAILRVGTEAQKTALLPDLAAGERFACVLYTEPEAGSDLGALATRAYRDDRGRFSLSGCKRYSLATEWSQIAICAARVHEEPSCSEAPSEAAGLTLFLVPLDAAGVSIHRVDSLADDPFYDVRLEETRVEATSVLGEVGGGWRVLVEALALERTGHDCVVKAMRWLKGLKREAVRLDLYAEERFVAELARLESRLEAAFLFSYHVTELITNERTDPVLVAAAKWYGSELAAEVVAVATQWLGAAAVVEHPQEAEDPYGTMEAAYRDVPGVKLAGGSSEMMLETIARFVLTD